jgi:hypothetical protein
MGPEGKLERGNEQVGESNERKTRSNDTYRGKGEDEQKRIVQIRTGT